MSDLHKALASALEGLSPASHPSWVKGFLPTGIPSLDWALGGGWRYGGLAEIYGPWSSGKTLLLYLTLISCQERGGTAIIFEREGAFNPFMFEAMGGDCAKLLIKTISTAEDFFKSVQKLCKKVIELKTKGEVVIALDSIAALSTEHLEKVGMEKKNLDKALVMSQGCQLIVSLADRSGALIIASNQVRVASFDARGNAREEATAGKAWPFYSSQRLQLSFANPKGQTTTHRTSDIVDEGTDKNPGTGVEIGKRLVAEVVKNRAGPPFRRVILPFYTEPQYPHPVFANEITALGVDADEALMEWYLSRERTFFLDGKREPYVVQDGKSGWFSVHPLIVGKKNVKKFQRKDWKRVLKDFPQLVNPEYDPTVKA